MKDEEKKQNKKKMEWLEKAQSAKRPNLDAGQVRHIGLPEVDMKKLLGCG